MGRRVGEYEGAGRCLAGWCVSEGGGIRVPRICYIDVLRLVRRRIGAGRSLHGAVGEPGWSHS